MCETIESPVSRGATVVAWSNRLSRPIAIKGAEKLLTLKDACDFIRVNFRRSSSNFPVGRLIKITGDALRDAANSGEDRHVDIATTWVEALLSYEELLEPPR